MYKLGDIVKIKPEWLNMPSERNNRYIVTNVNEVTKRCHIQCVTSDLALIPTELVGFDMIEKIVADRVIYAVIFFSVDGKTREEYEYTDIVAAKNHYNMFLNDDSGLYERILLTETVIGLPEVILQYKDL